MKRYFLLLAVSAIILCGVVNARAGAFLSFKDGTTSGDAFTPTVTKGATDQAFGRFSVNLTSTDFLTSVKVTYNGTRTGLSNFKLWFSTDNAFGGDTQLGATTAADPGDGGVITFAFSQSTTANTTYWLFVTADVASNATGLVRGFLGSGTTITYQFDGNYTESGYLSTADVPVPVVLSELSLE